MVPLFVFLISFAVLRCAGFLGVTVLNNADLPLAVVFSLCFWWQLLLTGVGEGRI
jgi:hypothetical protein